MKLFDDQYIVVTGAAGMIGSCVIRELNNRGMKNIICVDELGCDERWQNLVGKEFRDILEKKDFFEWLKGKESEIEAFIHLGACSSTVERDASFLLENNTKFTQRLAEYAVKNNHRFIYASSAATYGDGSMGFSDDHDGLEALRPLNMYGYSKHLFDLWAKAEGILDRVVGLKYFNVFGPNEYHKERMASAVLKMVPQVQKDGKVMLFRSSEPDKFSDGGQCRDFIYVKDAARITVDFLSNDRAGIFNVGTGQAKTWNELAEGVFLGLDMEPKIEYIDMPADLLGKYQNYTRADMSKFGDPACGDLKVSVAEYVKDYLLEGKRW